MRECVIVPTFDRPELLTLCLERIRKFEPNIPIHVFADRCQYDREAEVIGQFGATLHATPKHNTYGNSLNTLEAFKWAYEHNYEHIYLIEDDVLIHEDFFAFHREALENSKVSCGWKFTPEWGGGSGYHPIQGLPFYFSVGVGFRREFLHDVIRHAKDAYYSHQRDYIQKEFPRSNLPLGNFEQDGLILRVMEKAKVKAAWAANPVCTHAGDWFYGYNKPGNRKVTSLALARAIVSANDPNAPRDLSDVAVLVKTFLRPGYLKATLDSIFETMPEAHVVAVCDDDTTKVPDYVRTWIRLPFDSGFGAKANAAIPDLKQFKYALIASDDFHFTPEVRVGVEKMVKLLDLRPDIAVASGRVANNPYEGFLRKHDGIIEEIPLDPQSPWQKLSGIEYKLCDLTVNFSLIRTEVLGHVKWAEPYKIGGEHYEFFADLKRLGWLTAIVKGVSIDEFPHNPAWEDPRYGSYRGRAKDSWKLFAERNNVFAYKGFGGTVILPDVGQTIEKPPRPLLAIASCEAYKDRWQYLSGGVIFTGGLNVPDDYESLPLKVQAMCRWALANGYDYLFKCDDDTWVHIERLLDSGYEQYEYSGRFNSSGWASGGTGYWLSRKAMEIIVNATVDDWAEDRWIGSTLRKHGIVCRHDHRYTLLPDETAITPDFITACCTDTNIRGGFTLAKALTC